MKPNYQLFLIALIFFHFSVSAQVSKKSAVNINVLKTDSIRANYKSSESILTLNYQTGETMLEVKAESFSVDDSLLKKMFFKKINEIELHFNVSRAMLDLLKSDNKDHTADAPGMLYINNHFQSITINYSIYNKNGNTIDFANNNVLLSLQCHFSPGDFQLDGMEDVTREPMMVWLSKQPVNFLHTD